MDDSVGRLASLAYEVGLAEDIDELRTIVTHGLRTIVDADLASYTEVSLATGTTLALIDRPVIDLGQTGSRLAELAHQHPLITRHSPCAETISDHLTDRQFRSLELFHDIYEPLGAVDQLAVTIHHDEDVVVGLALNRSRRGFSHADRRALEAIALVVRSARSRVTARSRARALLAELERRAGATAPVGVIAVSERRVVAFIDERARLWLQRYFPDHHGPRLPPSLLARLLSGAASGAQDVAVERSDGVLFIRRLPARPGEPWLLELRERRREPRRALTDRELQVLDRIALGESNADIARALQISSRTVENHLRAIYRKLEVKSRTAALARLRD